METYTVLAMPVFPAWDEREGYQYVVRAKSKSEAIKRARRQHADNGHLGRIIFSAQKSDEIPYDEFDD
jgi:hypothetical protein